MTVSAASDVVIRPLAEADFDPVVSLDALHTGESKPDYWRHVFDDFLDTRGDRMRVGLVAGRGEDLAGFVLAEVRAFEFGSEPCGWILEIGVAPRFLRQQVGTRLLDRVCGTFRESNVTTVRTMVRRNNVPVLTFFRTNGFAGGPYVQLELTLDTGA